MRRIFALTLVLVSLSTHLAAALCPARHHQRVNSHSGHTAMADAVSHSAAAPKMAGSEQPPSSPNECFMSVSCTAPAAPVALERTPTAPITETPPSRLSDRFYTDPAQHIDRPPPRYTASA